MKTKFTPGPWVDDYFDRIDSRSGQIAVLNKGQGHGKCAANARLISAAPELYAVVRQFIDQIQISPDNVGVAGKINLKQLITDMKAALKKAEGGDE